MNLKISARKFLQNPKNKKPFTYGFCTVPADEYQSTENSVSMQDYDKKLQHRSRMKVFVLLPQPAEHLGVVLESFCQ